MGKHIDLSMLAIKPLSTNEAWQGRRFKTEKYKQFQTYVLLMLPNISIVTPTSLIVIFGFSNKAADIDNPLKMFIDCLAKRYDFNDKCLMHLDVTKKIVPKGCEYIAFSLK